MVRYQAWKKFPIIQGFLFLEFQDFQKLGSFWSTFKALKLTMLNSVVFKDERLEAVTTNQLLSTVKVQVNILRPNIQYNWNWMTEKCHLDNDLQCVECGIKGCCIAPVISYHKVKIDYEISACKRIGFSALFMFFTASSAACPYCHVDYMATQHMVVGHWSFYGIPMSADCT